MGEQDERDAQVPSPEEGGAFGMLMSLFTRAVSDADEVAALQRVTELRQGNPDATTEELVEKLIAQKVQKTGAVGAATSAASFVPGIGTLTGMTVGVAADIGATFKLQAELVLEIAAAHGHELDADEKRRITMLVTGASAGGNQLLRRGGERLAARATERLAGRALLKALPVLGVVASAGANAVSTFIIGRRAHAYFSLGESDISWQEGTRALLGMEEEDVTGWLDRSRELAGEGVERLKGAAGSVASVAGTAAGTVASAAGSAAGTVASAGQQVRRLLRRDGEPEPPLLADTSEEPEVTVRHEEDEE